MAINLEKNKKSTDYLVWAEFNYAVNISLRYKYVFVETPKVACSTIKHTLQKLELGDPDLLWDEFEDIHVRDLSPLLKPSQVNITTIIDSSDYFKFCFVRNPYTRLLSAYLEKIKGNKSQKKRILAQLGYNLEDINQQISFEDFVNAVAAQPISVMDLHWRVQYYQTFQDSINYSYIGKLEEFDDDFLVVLDRLGIKDNDQYVSKEQRHKSDANSSIEDYYTEAIRDIVFTKYKKDFDYFGYSSVLPEISSEPAKELDSVNPISEEHIKKINQELYFLTPLGIKEQQNERLHTVINEKDSELARTHKTLSNLEHTIKWMESSKFWKIRNVFANMKKKFTRQFDAT